MLCLTNETIQRQDGQDGMSDEQSGQIVTKETIVKRISKLNRNVLLNAMYILKSLLSSVKIHFRSGDYVDLTVHLICSLLTMFYYSPSGKHIDKDDHAE